MNALMQVFHAGSLNILWNVSWQVAVLVAFIWIVSQCAPNASPGFRYWLWCIVLVRLCIPLELSMPESVSAHLQRGMNTISRLFDQSEPASSLSHADAPHPDDAVENSAHELFPDISSLHFLAAPAVPVADPLTPLVVMLCWGIAIVALFSYLAFRVLRILKTLRCCPAVTDAAITALVERCCRIMGFQKSVEVRLSMTAGVPGPAVIGLWRPVVVLPKHMLDDWSAEELEPVLLHELAHIKRRDNMVNFLQVAVQVLYFFHPLVWYANHKIRACREDACDAAALERFGAQRKQYAARLLRVFEEVQERQLSLLAIGFTERKSSLAKRILHILNEKSNLQHRLTRKSVMALVLVGLCCGLLTVATTASYTNVPETHEYTIQLQSEPLDKYEFPYGGPVVSPRKSLDDGNEIITKYPTGLTLKYTYVRPLQGGMASYKHFCDDLTVRERFFNFYKEQTFEEWQSRYTREPVDHYVSVCIVENTEGRLVVVFDENNDEDLSNDQIHEFREKTFVPPYVPNEMTRTFASADVSVEYYDGNSIQNTTCGIRLCKSTDFEKRGRVFFSSINGYFGKVKLDGTTYTIGISKAPDVEFNKYETLWIDLNHNDRYDYGTDFNDQLYIPLTLGTKAYRLKDIARFNGNMTLEACDPAIIPPIAEGLPAPDFTETNHDSTRQITLSDYKGKYVLLDFWLCSGSICLPETDKIYQKFQDRDDFQIISVGPYSKESLRGDASNILLKWPHIKGLFEVNARTLYQVGGGSTVFFISPDGMILEVQKTMQSNKLIAMIEKYLK